MKESLNFFIAGFGMIPSEILAHQIEPVLEQLERRPERVARGWSGRRHSSNCSLRPGYTARRSALTALSRGTMWFQLAGIRDANPSALIPSGFLTRPSAVSNLMARRVSLGAGDDLPADALEQVRTR